MDRSNYDDFILRNRRNKPLTIKLIFKGQCGMIKLMFLIVKRYGTILLLDKYTI